MAFSQAARDAAAVTRRQNAEARAAEKLMSTGVGPSKIFCDPDAPQEDAKLLDCHINGKLIRDLGFTPLQLSALSWHITDEGIEERNRGKSEIRASVTMDPLQKSMQKRKDDVLNRGMETWEAENAMQSLLKANEEPGYRYKFVSTQAKNVHASAGGWEPVVKNGDPVKLNSLILARMPEERAKARNKHYQDLAAQRLKQNNQQYMESGGATAVSDQ